MPKPLKKKRTPPHDVNQWARHLVEQSTAEPDTESAPTIAPAALSAYMSAIGRKGGKESGARRMDNLSRKTRKDIAKKAAAARWKGHTKKAKT